VTSILGSGRSSLLLTAALLAAAATPNLPVFPVTRRRGDDGPLWPPTQTPDDRGRRAEKDALALEKAEAKRKRKAAKRAKDMKAPNV
jgi:hypothetical protein